MPNDATITAVSGNLTATGSAQAGFLRLMPEGSGSSVSTLNYGANQTRANNFNLGLSSDGKLTIILFGGVSGHGIIDLNGYYKNDGTIGSQAWRLTLRDEGNRLATEYTVTSTAARLKNYFYFGNLLVATRDSAGASLYYHSDHLGTPRLVTNSSAQKVEEHKYFPYGQPLSPGLGSQPHKLAAMEQDATSGFFFDHARYLGNGTAAGKFLSPDRLGGKLEDPQSWNRYVYALSNPLKYIDPTGKEAEFAIENRIHMMLEGEINEQEFHAANRMMAGGALAGVAVAGAESGLAGLATAALSRLGLAGPGSILLGETMNRVSSVAPSLKASTFSTSSREFAQMMSQNVSWLQTKITSGARIFDIGINPVRSGGRSPFYSVEVQQLLQSGFQRVFQRVVMINGQAYKLYEWIKKPLAR